MSERRSIFLLGLSVTIRRFPALLWAYVFNLGLALLFSLRLHTQLASILDHSLAAQRLINGFDLGTVAGTFLRFQGSPAESTATSYLSVPLFLLLYFVLIPGTLFCYETDSPARLSTLSHQGLLHFWRFVRITILTLILSGVVLGLLSFLQTKWAEHVDEHAVGFHSFLARMAGIAFILLVACFLRLYFDLVEVYTVQVGLHIRSNGRSDRRVLRTFAPAWRVLRANFAEAFPIFLLLAILGAAAVLLTARLSVHMLAQPRVWPAFLLTQFGLFLMLLTRFWQRGVETSLAMQFPIYPLPQLPVRSVAARVAPLTPVSPSPIDQQSPTPPDVPRADLSHGSGVMQPIPPIVSDPIPDPEPASPSLDEPDLGIFHRRPDEPQR